MAALNPPSLAASRLEWGVASKASPGQTRSGDLHVVAEGRWGVLAAAIDGLGHGEEASAAAGRAADVLRRHAGKPVVELVRLCHQELKTTRGAVMTLVCFDPEEDRATAVGIGNVEAILVRARAAAEPRTESVLLRGGLVGLQLPEMQPSQFDLGPGDVIIFTTDGVGNSFAGRVPPTETAQGLADRLLRENFLGHDDGLVLAVRYRGGGRRG